MREERFVSVAIALSFWFSLALPAQLLIGGSTAQAAEKSAGKCRECR
jgi:hypothetical protein